MVGHFSHYPPFSLGRVGSVRRRVGPVHLKKRRIDGRSGIPALAFPGGGRAGGAAGAAGIGAGVCALAASARLDASLGCHNRWPTGRHRQAAEAKQCRAHAPEGEHAFLCFVMGCVYVAWGVWGSVRNMGRARRRVKQSASAAAPHSHSTHTQHTQAQARRWPRLEEEEEQEEGQGWKRRHDQCQQH
jgi:hypothetical protein